MTKTRTTKRNWKRSRRLLRSSRIGAGCRRRAAADSGTSAGGSAQEAGEAGVVGARLPRRKPAGQESSGQEGAGQESSGQESPAKKAAAKKAPAKKAAAQESRQEGSGQEGCQEGASQEGCRQEGCRQESAGQKGSVKKAPAKKAREESSGQEEEIAEPGRTSPVKPAPAAIPARETGSYTSLLTTFRQRSKRFNRSSASSSGVRVPALAENPAEVCPDFPNPELTAMNFIRSNATSSLLRPPPAPPFASAASVALLVGGS